MKDNCGSLVDDDVRRAAALAGQQRIQPRRCLGLRLPVFVGVITHQFVPEVAALLSGALVTAVLFSIGRYGIAVYLTYTATTSTYGAAGSVVLILLWVYYSSLIPLFGAAYTKTQLLASGRSVVSRNSAVLVRWELVTDA